MPKESFLVNRIKSVGFAIKGALLLIRTESSIKIQVFIGLVLGIEGLNTAVEKIADFVQPEFDEKIGFIKDVSAGAVMLVSIAASIIGLIIYIPKIF